MQNIKTNPNPNASQIQEVICNQISIHHNYPLYIENEDDKAELIQSSTYFQNWLQTNILSHESSETVLYIESDSDLLIPFISTLQNWLSDPEDDTEYDIHSFSINNNHIIHIAIN